MPGNTGNKRTPDQHEADLALISDWMLEGVTQREMARRISELRPYTISQQQIQYDAKILRDRWYAQSVAAIDRAKSIELAKLDRLEAEYWKGWHASCKDRVRKRQRDMDGLLKPTKGSASPYEEHENETVTEESAGDPRFLAGILTCISKRCEIRGMYAPKQLKVEWREAARQQGVDPDVVSEQLIQQFQAALLRGETGKLPLQAVPALPEPEPVEGEFRRVDHEAEAAARYEDDAMPSNGDDDETADLPA